MIRLRNINRAISSSIHCSPRIKKLKTCPNKLSKQTLSTWSESQKFYSNIVKKELKIITQQLDFKDNKLDGSPGSINVKFLNVLCNVLKSDNQEHLRMLSSLNIPFKYYMNCDIHVNEDEGDDIASAYKQFLDSVITFNNHINYSNFIVSTDIETKLSDNASGILKLAIVLAYRLRQYETLHLFLKQLFTDIFEHQKSAAAGLNTIANVTHMLKRVEGNNQKFIPVWIYTSMMEILMTQYLPLQERINSGKFTDDDKDSSKSLSSNLTLPIKSYATPKQTLRLLQVYWLFAKRIDHNMENVKDIFAPNESIERHYASFSTTATANVQNGLKPLSDVLVAIQMAHEDDEFKTILPAKKYQGFRLRLLQRMCKHLELDLEISTNDRGGHHVISIPEHVPPLKGPLSLHDMAATLKHEHSGTLHSGILREPSYWAILEGYLNRLPNLTIRRAVTSSLISFRNTQQCVGWGLLLAEQAFDPSLIQMEDQKREHEYKQKTTNENESTSDLGRLMNERRDPLPSQIEKSLNSLWKMAERESDIQGLMFVLTLSMKLTSYYHKREGYLLRALEFVRHRQVKEEWLYSIMDMVDQHTTQTDVFSLRLLLETVPFLVTKNPKAESTWKAFQQLAFQFQFNGHTLNIRASRIMIITSLSQLLLTTIATSDETSDLSMIEQAVDIPFSMTTPLYESSRYLTPEDQCMNRLKKNLKNTQLLYGSIPEPLMYLSSDNKGSQQELRNEIQNDLFEVFCTTDLAEYVNSIPRRTKDAITLTVVYTSFLLSHYDHDLDRAFDLMYYWADAVKKNEFKNNVQEKE